MTGPLNGLTFIELAGIGPGPFCGMMLADMGATVIRIDRPGGNPHSAIGHTVLFRNRQNLAVDLKSPEGIETVLKLCETADGLFEGFRPGVAERLGIGPEECMARNPKLVYGRMTGWGQTGPLSQAAGHDINYISLSGALHGIGRAGDKPVPPLNLVGDFGGGGMFLAFGVVSAMLEAQRSGAGQVVDVSMVEGSAALMHMMYSYLNTEAFNWQDERGVNVLDTGAHFYEVYETQDGKHLSVGPIEPQFYQLFKEKIGLDEDTFGGQFDVARWPELKEKLAAVFKTRTRDAWCELLEGTDACVAPVLSMREAPLHPHNKARESFVEVGGHVQPGPAPKFSRSRPEVPQPAPRQGQHTDEVLAEAGYDQAQLAALRAEGVLT